MQKRGKGLGGRASILVLSILGSVAFLVTSAIASEETFIQYRPDIDGYVLVEGTSSAHDWKAEGQVIEGLFVFRKADLSLLWSSGGSDSYELFPKVHVEIPVRSLKSGKNAMDKKMYSALKEEEQPVITYRLDSLMPGEREVFQEDEGAESRMVRASGVLMVAGTERAIDIPMRISRFADSRLEISGSISLRMTDFEIMPPKAMLGMLQTGDAVNVFWKWGLVQEPLPNAN